MNDIIKNETIRISLNIDINLIKDLDKIILQENMIARKKLIERKVEYLIMGMQKLYLGDQKEIVSLENQELFGGKN